MTTTTATLTDELNALVTDIPGVYFIALRDGVIAFHENGEWEEIDDFDYAIEFALELSLLHDDVVANPNDYHVDTLAHHGVMLPTDHPQRAEIIPPCASGRSADCTGEGTAYAGRCLPCDLDASA